MEFKQKVFFIEIDEITEYFYTVLSTANIQGSRKALEFVVTRD
jgi:hypothetical protein